MKKKIILLAQTLYGGGAEKYVVNLANNLILQNYSVEVVVFKKINNDYSSLINKKIPIYYLHSNFSIIISIKIFLFILKKLNNKPVVITNMRGTTLSCFLLIFLKKKIKWIAREANIISPHLKSLSKYKKYVFLLKLIFLYKKIFKIICVSDSVKKEIEEICHIDQKKLHVIHNPITNIVSSYTANVDNRYQFLKKKNFILSVGRLHPQKNYEELILVFKEVIKKIPKLYLVICGSGNEYQKLYDLVKKNNLENSVIFTGFIIDISFFYQNATIYCSTSMWEGSPNSILEAISHNLPIIAFKNYSGTDEILSEEKNLAEMHDIKKFSELVIDYIKSPKKVKYDLILKNFSNDKFINNHLEIINN